MYVLLLSSRLLTLLVNNLISAACIYHTTLLSKFQDWTLRSFSTGNGKFLVRFFLRVAVTSYVFLFNAKHKRNVANQLSKNTSFLVMFQETFPQQIGQSFFRFSFYHCIEKSCTLKIWWSSPNKIFKTPFFVFLGFCWRIKLYFALAGIICWSVESCLSGSTKMQLFLTWSNTG